MREVNARSSPGIILDTDIGSDVDDLLALAYVLSVPGITVRMISTVSGKTRVRAAIARKICRLASRENIPVVAGVAEPLTASGAFVWFGTEGEGILSPTDIDQMDDLDHPDPIAALALELERCGCADLVCIGPLTNIAMLVLRFPECRKFVGKVTIMGGSFGSARIGVDPVPARFDYNLCADADAARIVLNSGFHICLVPLDVTLKTSITAEEIGSLSIEGTSFQALLVEQCRRWTPVLHAILAGFGIRAPNSIATFLHDPLAVACAVGSTSACKYLRKVRVERSMIPLRLSDPDDDAPGTVAVELLSSVDSEAFRAHFLKQLKGMN
ncbi:purine nucleosidase [Bradyrhizobium japonicum]